MARVGVRCGALYRVEARMGARRRQGASLIRLAGARVHRVPAEEVLLGRRGAVRVSVGEVVGRREAELIVGTSRGRGPRFGRWGEARRAGLGARGRGALELGQPASDRAVGSTVNLDLLVAGETELMRPDRERHGEWRG